MSRLENAQKFLKQAVPPLDGDELNKSFVKLVKEIILSRNPDNYSKVEELEKLVDGYEFLKHRRFWRRSR